MFWRNSNFIKGQRGGAGSVIDFAIEFGGCKDVKSAMRTLATSYGIRGDKPVVKGKGYIKNPQAKIISYNNFSNSDKNISLELPQNGDNNETVKNYLCKERGIDASIVSFMFSKDMLYEDNRKNCVFVSESKRFACFRGTKGRFLGDVLGSDYNECFFFYGSSEADTVIVAESVTDIMSIMTKFMREGNDYINYFYLVLSGTNKLPSLYYHLDKDINLKRVVLAFDNDDAGFKTKDIAIEELSKRNFNSIEVMSPPYGKDWNDAINRKEKE